MTTQRVCDQPDLAMVSQASNGQLEENDRERFKSVKPTAQVRLAHPFYFVLLWAAAFFLLTARVSRLGWDEITPF